MADATQELRHISWGECFRFVNLFRAFRLALHPTKLILAFCGVLATCAAGWAFDGMWVSSCQPAVTADGQVSELEFYLGCPSHAHQMTLEWKKSLERPGATVRRTGVFHLLLYQGRVTTNLVAGAALSADLPRVLAAFSLGCAVLAWLVHMHLGYTVVLGLTALLIWALFGGAVARAAALHATRDEKIGARDSLRFARSKFLSFVASPLMALGPIVVAGILLFVGGLVGWWIPAVGEVLVALFFGLALAAGFIIAFLIIGGSVGYPLTFPTIAVEGSDAFDALSRTISYVYQRPWRTAFYTAVTLVYGAVCFLFVKFFVRIMLWSLHLFVGLSMNLGHAYVTNGSDPAAASMGKLDAIWQAPSLVGDTPFIGTFNETNLAHMSWFAQLLIKFWIFALWGLVAAYVVSFFYSSSTLIYLLLRREVDATDLEEVYVEEPPESPAAAASPAAPAPAGGGTSLPVVS